MKMFVFETGVITAFPTDTSFGLGVRADDVSGLEKLYQLKQRPAGKFFSLMVKDWEMLHHFAHVPAGFSADFFTAKPRTVILNPTDNLPVTPYWPRQKVAFRIATIPEVQAAITYPITATSANFSGQDSLYDVLQLKQNFGEQISLFPGFETLPIVPASEIWDYSDTEVVRIR